MMDKLQAKLTIFMLAFTLARLSYLRPKDQEELQQLQDRPSDQSVTHIFESADTGTQGLIYIDHTTKSIFIAYCGTQNLQDWGTNLRVLKRPLGNINIHRGVRAAIGSVRDRVLVAIESYREYRIYLIGHSLGGMCASAACAWLEDRYSRTKDIVLITIGAGMIASTRDINEAIKSPHYRFQNGSDAVPRRPNIPLFYGHPTGENHCHIYFPNRVKELGRYVFNPSWMFMLKDRLLTLGERLSDHDAEDYEFKLSEVVV